MYIVVINNKQYGPYTMEQIAGLKKAGTLTQYKAKVYKARTKQQAAPAPAALVMPEPTKVAAPAQPITGHVTTERTGKRHKENMIYAWTVVIISGFVFFSFGMGGDLGAAPLAAIGSLGFIGGLIWLYVIKWQVWWHHG